MSLTNTSMSLARFSTSQMPRDFLQLTHLCVNFVVLIFFVSLEGLNSSVKTGAGIFLITEVGKLSNLLLAKLPLIIRDLEFDRKSQGEVQV